MLLRALIWPFTLPAVIVLLLFTLGMALVLQVLGRNIALDALSFLFVPWCYLLCGLLTLCGQQKLAAVARGRVTEHVAAVADLNPFSSGLALKLVLLVLGIPALQFMLPEQTGLLAGVAFIYPAVYLALVLEESLREGLRFGVLLRILTGTGPVYLLLVGLVSGSAGWLIHVLINDQRLLMVFVATYVYLLAQPLAGWLLYLRRGPLLLHTEFSPEQDRAAAAAAQAQALEDQLDALHRLSSTGAVKQANIKLEAFTGGRTVEMDPLVHERLRDLRYTRLFLEHGVYYLQRLVDRGELKKAWAVFKDCHASEERFRPLSAQVLLDITRVAGREDARLVEELLGDLAQAYPDSELISEAMFRQARINIELLGNGNRGIQLLQQLENAYPEYASGETYQAYRSRLRIRRRQ